MRTARLSGAGAYAFIVLWLLLAMMRPLRADAAEAPQVRAADLMPAIRAALIAEGVSADAHVTLADPDARIAVAVGEPAFDSVAYNPATGRFLIRLIGAAAPAIVGSAREAVTLPVLIGDFRRGDVIHAEDIAFLETTEARPGEFIEDPAALEGAQARRALRAGAPLRKSDIAPPRLVGKGAVVTMLYAAPGLSLTHTGTAEADGGAGEVIAVKNLASGRVVKAAVSGANAVTVIGVAGVEP